MLQPPQALPLNANRAKKLTDSAVTPGRPANHTTPNEPVAARNAQHALRGPVLCLSTVQRLGGLNSDEETEPSRQIIACCNPPFPLSHSASVGTDPRTIRPRTASDKGSD